jgi:hypothetical protein
MTAVGPDPPAPGRNATCAIGRTQIHQSAAGHIEVFYNPHPA